MIQTKCNLVGHISTKGNLTGNLNNSIEYIYPELEDLTVTSSTEQQTFKSENYYGYDNVTVEAVKSEELSIMPSATEQIKKGIFNKVTVAGDSDLAPENIIKDKEIFGVAGTANATSAKITNGFYLFYNNTRLDSLKELLKLCRDITNMSNMFYNCNSLTNLDLSSFNASNVTNMSNMFCGCNRLTNLDLSNFDTSNVTSMLNMFYDCKKLKELNLSSFNTSNVTNMSNMFYGCNSLTNLDLNSFNTSNVTSMAKMFYNCTKLKELNLSNFNISNVTSMSSMFGNCYLLTNLDLKNFNENKVTDIGSLFYSCSNLTNLDLDNFDASKITNINDAFTGCKNLMSFKGLKDLGKSYIQKTKNYTNYSLNLSVCTLLTHESLMSVINNLYDLNLTYDVANGGTLYSQRLVLGSANLEKLTAEEIAIATNKGWTVS